MPAQQLIQQPLLGQFFLLPGGGLLHVLPQLLGQLLHCLVVSDLLGKLVVQRR